MVLVDEKVRRGKWNDVLLEIWSDRDRRIRGWLVKDLHCDYIAYAFMPTKEGLCLPFQLLRMAWRQHGQDWARRYRQVEAHNPGYITMSYAIPTDVLLDAVKDAMQVQYAAMGMSIEGGGDQRVDQLAFTW